MDNKFFEIDPREDARLRSERAETNRQFWREDRAEDLPNRTVKPVRPGGRPESTPKEGDPRFDRA